jgi:hypothetical protein
MVSYTAQTTTRREMRKRAAGRKAKKLRVRAGNPAFPIHPDGYDKKAPDAKPEAK